jgi:O-antigen/teichoic acid export membrane protein
MATVFFGLNIILSNALMVRMKTSVLLKMNAFAAAVNIALNLIFLAIFKNVLVAAFTTLIGYATVFVFIRRAVMVDWPLRFEYGAITKSIMASVFMGGALHGISVWLGTRASGGGSILSQALVGVVIYGLALFAMKTFSHKELSYFKKAFAWG